MPPSKGHSVSAPASTATVAAASASLSGDRADDMALHDASTTSLPSPSIAVEFHGDPGYGNPGHVRPHMVSHSSAPAVPQFQSPIRQHKRTPSAHREVKETLNARSEYTNDEQDGRSHHTINQYVIKEEIGRGSYGAVHLATDQFGNEYAVKEFSKARLRKRAQSHILRRGPRRLASRFPPRAGFGAPDMRNDSLSHQERSEAHDALFLIREEIAIMKKLNHPNLVQLIEVLDDPEEDSLYMVLEMCKKGVIMKVGLGEPADPYPEEGCRCWFRDLILGIEYLHAQGVVHRDIKPDNLLLTEDDILKVVDFGVSEMFERSGEMMTAKSAGSPAFLPPELCVARHGDVSGKAADIWSMGVSLYCLRYGRIPFEKTGVLEMFEAIKTDTAPLPPDENEDFRDLMTRILEKDPEKRITMNELRDHRWVTNRGEDPLLHAEENCSDLVDPPNELEVNHAFTRRMTHLLCVMKAIAKFKSLLPPKGSPERLRLNPNAIDDDATPRPPSVSDAQRPRRSSRTDYLPPRQPTDPEKSTAEHAAAVLRERERFFSGDPSHERGHAHDPTDVEPLFLGIGAGGHDDFGHGHPGHAHVNEPARDEVVSDSPTAVDFDVYDRAFEAEVDRIRRSGSRRKRTGTMYLTRHVGEKEAYRRDENMVEGGTHGEHASAGNLNELVKRRFANAVAQAMPEGRS